MPPARENWAEQPLVTAVLIFTCGDHLHSARASVKSFLAQDWPHKELLVYNATQHSLRPAWWQGSARVREIKLRRQSEAWMLQLCFDNAQGEWCLIWLADCYYATNYIRYHMQHRDRLQLVQLRRKTAYILSTRQQATIINDTIPSWSCYCRRALDFSKNLPEQFAGTRILDNPAGLLTKFVNALR